MIIAARIFLGIIIFIFIVIAWILYPNNALSELSDYFSIVIGVIGILLTLETFALAKTLKEQRSSASLKQTLAEIIDDLGGANKSYLEPDKKDVSRVHSFAELLEQNNSINNDKEVKGCIAKLKAYKATPPESNREIVDVLNQIQNTII